MAVEDNFEISSWTCPKCGEVVSGFTGPATRRLALDNHEYWKHERPERQAAQWVAKPPVTIFDEFFYEGKHLSREDDSFLENIHAAWKLSLDKSNYTNVE